MTSLKRTKHYMRLFSGSMFLQFFYIGKIL